MTFILPIPRQTDRSLLDHLKALSVAKSGSKLSITLLTGKDLSDEDIINAEEIFDEGTYSVSRAALRWERPSNNGNVGFTISIERRSFTNSPNDSDPLLDTLKIQKQGDYFSDTLQEASLINQATKLFKVGFASQAGDRNSTRLQRQILTSSHSLVQSVHSGIDKTVSDFHKFVASHTAEMKREKSQINSELEKKRAEIESTYQEKFENLEKRRRELDEKETILDDRSNTHARREIRNDLIRLIESRNIAFGLSEKTNEKRKPINVLFIGVLFGFAALFLTNITLGESLRINADDSIQIIIVKLLRNLVPIAGFFASALVYLRWMNSWAQKHADFEFGQRQFELDINRASWAVESALEWKQSQGSTIPPQLLDGITRQLFEQRQQDSGDNSALDALASALVGSASKLRLKVGDNEIELGPREIKKLAAKHVDTKPKNAES